MADYYLRGKLIPKGERGYSAYEIAVQQGFIGTEQEWLDSLAAGERASIVQEIASTSSNATIPSTLAVYNFVEGSIADFMEEQIKSYVAQVTLEKSMQENPVGHIRLETTNTNPSEYLGFGTWQLWGQGRVPIGIDTNDTDFNTVEKTGGSKTVSLTEAQMPSHTHSYNKSATTTGSTTLNINQIPSHNHSIEMAGTRLDTNGNNIFRMQTNTPTSGGGFWNLGLARTGDGTHDANITKTGGGQGHTHSITSSSTNTGSKGSGQAHNNMQPYITCYMWKRVA
jgi:microcystin-dependent protein